MIKNISFNREAGKWVDINITLGISKVVAGLWSIVSIGTARTYFQTYVLFIKYLVSQGIKPDKAIHKDGENFLIKRSEKISQATLNRDRIALQHHFKKRFKYFRSKVPAKQKMPRRYSYGQVTQLLMQVKNPLRISILLALTAGVRACELYTIAPLEDQPESIRTWLRERFLFMPGCRPYTVRGKGGLVRTIMVPVWLSLELEAYRRLASVRITDRGIYRQSCYDIVGGKKFSNQFSRAAKKVLGFSNGAHGLRGTYAQVRLTTLVQMDVPFEKARLIVAQELGHFSPANLRYYLPGSCFHKFLLKGGRCELKGYDASELKMSAAADLHSLANASFLH